MGQSSSIKKTSVVKKYFKAPSLQRKYDILPMTPTIGSRESVLRWLADSNKSNLWNIEEASSPPVLPPSALAVDVKPSKEMDKNDTLHRCEAVINLTGQADVHRCEEMTDLLFPSFWSRSPSLTKKAQEEEEEASDVLLQKTESTLDVRLYVDFIYWSVLRSII